MQRVAVVGSGGAGKTTFSAELGRRTGLPVFHLDRYHWRPGWTAPPAEEWERAVAELASGEAWIIDGNYSRTLDLRLARADTVIVLGLSRYRCTARVLRRSILNRGREIQADGCPERVDAEFVRWVWRFPIDSRPRLDQALERHRQGLEVEELRSPAQVRRFLARI